MGARSGPPHAPHQRGPPRWRGHERDHPVRGEVMEVLRRFRGGAVTAALFVAVIACSQVLPRLDLPIEPQSFALTPEGDEVSRLSPVTVTFGKPPADRTPENLLQVFPSTVGSYAWLSPRTLLFQPDFP